MDPLLYAGIAAGLLVLLVILWKITKFAIKVALIVAVLYFGYQWLAPLLGLPLLPGIPSF